MKKFKLGVVIYTYNRIDDSRINMEIINTLWKDSDKFDSVQIAHSFNGEEPWYPNKYLEDYIVRSKNLGHFEGDSNLLDLGFEEFSKNNLDADYVVFMASDTWIIKPDFIQNTIDLMNKDSKYLAASSWNGLPDKPGDVMKSASVDLFIVDYKWFLKNKIFPLDFTDFKNKYSDLFYYQGGEIMVEKLLMAHFLRAIHSESKNDAELSAIARSKVHSIIEREPVHSHIDENGLWVRKMYWSEIGLITNHKPDEKQKILKDLNLRVGKFASKLIDSTDTSYYNNGFISFQKVN